MTRRMLMLVAAASLLGAAGRCSRTTRSRPPTMPRSACEVEGIVKEFVWRNPHSFVRIDVTTPAGVTETWNLEWGSISQLSAAKFPVTRTTLRAGDRIIAGGEPARDPGVKRIRIFSITRPIDGWQWEGVVD